jgi:hypothetical protein
MSLKDQGYRFCVSPNKQDARWLAPNIWKAMHADWIDVTDWSSEKLVAFVTPEPQQEELFSA